MSFASVYHKKEDLLMGDFFARCKEKLQGLSSSAYGVDDLSKVLLSASLVLLLISAFTRNGLVFALAFIALGYSWFRTLSSDRTARAAENAKFARLIERAKKTLRIQKKRFDSRKEYRFFKCPGCTQQVRVPRGKGHIRITCPKCRTQFDRTT